MVLYLLDNKAMSVLKVEQKEGHFVIFVNSYIHEWEMIWNYSSTF